MRAWLRSGLREGSWALADRVIGHAAAERASQWRGAANVPVLVGLMRSPGSQEHLDWIRTERLYY